MIKLAQLFDKQKWQTGNDDQFNLTWLFIFAFGLIFTGIGLRDAWPADEPRFAAIAKEMVETGQWFFPMRGGELYPDKPPVFMWSIAIFYLLTGSIKFAFLLPNALCSLVTLYLVYDLGKRYWSSQVGFHAALLLLLTIQFTLQAKTAQIDAMVCCWITLGCYGLLRHFLDNGNWQWYAIGGFFMGLGVITKGVGFLPILMLIPYALIRWRKPLAQEIKGGWRWWLVLLTLLGAIMLWFIPMLYLVEHSNNPVFEQYRDNILLKQTAKRYAHSWHHVKPFWYYIVNVVPVFWLPLSAMLPWLAKHWKNAWQQNDRRIMLPLCWIAIVLIFFSISPGKRGVYILPAVPMLALITAPYLRNILTSKGFNRLIYAIVALLTSILFVLSIGGLSHAKFALKLVAKYPIEPWYFLFALATSGMLALWISRKQKFKSWLLFIPALWLIYSTWGYSLLQPIKTPKNVYAKMQTLVPNNAEIGIVGLREQFLLFTPYSTTHFGYHTPEKIQFQSAWQWQQNNNQYVLTFNQLAHSCYDETKAIPLARAHSRDWVLYPITAKLATCDTSNAIAGFHYQPSH